jgi:Cobalamin-independent synthase, Catalytic domain
MFAMLCGAWPRVTSEGVDVAALEAAVGEGGETAAALEVALARLVAEAIAAQVEAGMDLVTDGQVRWPDMGAAVLAAAATGRLGEDGPLVTAWRAANAPAGVTLAQAVPGPYTLGRRAVDEAAALALAAGETAPTEAEREADRARVTIALADSLSREVEALAVAGCPMILVEEPGAARIGEDDAERALFAATTSRLLSTAGPMHPMLVITGGSAHEAGVEAIFAAPWQSVLVDLVAGPDNWHLVRSTPGDRGVVCAALTVRDDEVALDQSPQLVWAAHYAASANGRGIARVGLANASSLATRTPERARRALADLATAARYAGMSPADAVDAGLDPRTISDPRPIPANRAARRQRAREAGQDH